MSQVEASAQTITPYTVSVSPTTVCAGQTATIHLSGSQTYTANHVVYGVVSLADTNAIIVGPVLGNGTALNFAVTPSITTTYGVAGVIVGTQTVVMQPFVTVTVDPLPTASITVSSPTICIGTSATISASSSNPNNSYSLTPGGTFFSSTTVTPTVTTNYILMVKDDLTTCVNTSTITITVETMPANVNWNPPPICIGGPPIHLNHTLAPGALHGGMWTINGNTSPSDSVLNISTATVGTSYLVTYSAGTGSCAASQSDTLIVHGLPHVTVNSPVVCLGSTTTLIADSAASYTWAPNTALSATTGSMVSVSPTTSASINYTVTGTDVFGCVNTASTTVMVYPLPTINVNTPTICVGTATTLTATGASSYTWNTGAITTTITASPTVTTNYTVTGTGTHNCKAVKTTTVTVNPLPIITVKSDTLCAGDSAVLLAQGAINYMWIPSASLNTSLDSFVIASPTITTIYTVTGTNASNCKHTTTCTSSQRFLS